MIIVKLSGGLENQLFQYAYGKAYSLQKNQEFFLDISWYAGRLDRKYMLDNFNIQVKKVSLLNKIISKLFFPKNYLEDPIGNWHNEKYFKEYSNILKKEFILRKPLSAQNQEILKKIESSNSVSLHLRGGDYVTGKKSTFHGTCSPEYYKKAIEIIQQKMNSPEFFIFTDDIEWARNHITFPRFCTLVSSNNSLPWEELKMMSLCKHNIIANSTFSWWGAWLNDSPNKIIIAPKKWFNNEQMNTGEIIPNSWIKI